MIVKIAYDKNPHQAEFHDDLISKILHLSTGYGGGKSYSLLMKIFLLSWLNRPFPGGLVAPSRPDFKKDLEPLIEEILDKNRIKYRYHKTENWIQFPWSPGKLQIVSAEKKIKGPNWAYAGINECTLIKYDRFKEVLGRVRIKGAPYPQIAMSGTPEGINSWVPEILIEKPMKRSRIIFGSTRANAHNLADDFIPTLESNYDQAMLDAYLDGQFVNMNGNAFYYAWSQKNVNDALAWDRDQHVCVTLDYNVQPMCATLWHLKPVLDGLGYPLYDIHRQPMMKACAFDQVKIENNATTQKMSDLLEEYGLLRELTTIYPDPAGKARSTNGPPDNEILRENRWEVKVKLAAPQYRKRQLAVNNMISKGWLEVHPRCKGLIRDFQAVQQDRFTYEKLKDNPELTHFSDGCDYFIDIEFPLAGTRPPSGSVKFR